MRLFASYSFIVLGAMSLAACGDGDNDEEEASGGNGSSTAPTTAVAVDLGLPSGTKWADRNVGAIKPEGPGYYFAWGETSPKDSYSEDNSVAYGVSYSDLQSKGIIDSNGNLTATYDAATANWSSKWRMPTQKEIDELCNNCIWIWTSKNDVYGHVVTGPNGNSIFLPAAGFRYYVMGLDDYTQQAQAGSDGYYWSSTAIVDDPYCAYYLLFDSDDHSCTANEEHGIIRPNNPIIGESNYNHRDFVRIRHYGHSVRPVASK